jgi:hypothetical protein
MKAACADYFWENGGNLAGEALGKKFKKKLFFK